MAEDILNAIETLVCVVDGEGNLVYISPAVERILGYPLADVLGQGWWDKAYSGDLELGRAVRTRLIGTARGEVPVFAEAHTAKAYSASGVERWIVWRDARGPGELVIGVGQDIADLHNAEAMAAQRESEFRAIFDHASDGMLLLNSDWIYLQANEAACEIFGLPRKRIIGQMQGTVRHAEVDFRRFREKALQDGRAQFEVCFEREDKEVRHVELSIATNVRAGHHLIILRDITERRKLQMQLSEAQRLEAVGRLAGGVAHDFNNMLTAIRGYAELLQRNMTDERFKRYVDAIMGASLRAAQTTQQLLAFSRKQRLAPKLINLNNAISDTLRLLQRVIGEDIDLVPLLSPDAGDVMVDPGQFSQILMNLAVNSRDAMPGGGKLIIETRGVVLDDEYVLRHIQVEPGAYSMMAFTDTGSGITPEILPHIFEPFFTTKEVGKGTGLGLATVYGIVKQSGGYVWVYSEVGQGTTFKIYLPRVLNAPRPKVEAVSEQGTILVIEDDEVTRQSTAEALTRDGHMVLQAADGSEALEVCQRRQEAIDLVLTDVTASRMSGEDLMGYFAAKYPRIAVVHMSGFSRTRLEQAGDVFSDAEFLPKPFTVAQLREKIQLALQRRTKAFQD